MKLRVESPPTPRPLTGTVEANAPVGSTPSEGGVERSPPLLPPLSRATASALLLGSRGVAIPANARAQAAWSPQAKAIATGVLNALSPGPAEARVRQAMALLLAQPALTAADVSCTVLDAQGAPIVEHRAEVATNPCSNAKVVTAAFALSVLGPAHRFVTTLAQAPDGALVVTGRFDPSMTRAIIDDIARELRARGIAEVPRLVLDVSAMQGTNVPASFASYGEEDWEYLARPEPLSVDRNTVKLLVTPGSGPGAPASIEADSGAYAVRARVETVTPGSQFHVACDELQAGGVLERDARGRPILDVWGTIAADYHKGKALVMKSPAPLEQVGFAWRDAFEQAGLRVGNVEVGGAVTGATTLLEHKSKPLAVLLQTSLATSNAFDHEMFALAAAHAQAGRPVSLQEAAERLTSFLCSLGVEGVLVNGSGIGNESAVPARAVAMLLARARHDPALASLLDGLSQPGVSGTLKSRMLDTAAEQLFRGKTGTGEGAVALSGVCGPYVMSVLVEHMKSRRDDARAALDACAMVLSTLALEGS